MMLRCEANRGYEGQQRRTRSGPPHSVRNGGLGRSDRHAPAKPKEEAGRSARSLKWLRARVGRCGAWRRREREGSGAWATERPSPRSPSYRLYKAGDDAARLLCWDSFLLSPEACALGPTGLCGRTHQCRCWRCRRRSRCNSTILRPRKARERARTG